jgi:glycosyltransferase involved in cell wall biosynthesis
MNIVVCHSQVPYVRGGNEVLVDGLVAALREAGHRVELLALPFKWYPKAQLERQSLAWRMLDVERLGGRKVDLAICTKFPTWAVRHPRKVVWLVHQHRQAYDWYGTPLSDFGLTEEDQRARRVVLETDSQGIGEAERVYTISKNVAVRLARYNGLTGIPLYPATHHDHYHHTEYGDYIFTMSRLDSAKRLDLFLAGLKKTRSAVQAIIAGSGPEAERLKAKAASLGLANRVKFVGRVSDEEAVRLYAGALAVFFAPVDEDYGYITVEAMRSSKAVITAPDSGGVLEFVRHEQNGYICPDAAAFGAAFDALYFDQSRELAARLGVVARETIQVVPSWAEIVKTLTE